MLINCEKGGLLKWITYMISYLLIPLNIFFWNYLSRSFTALFKGRNEEANQWVRSTLILRYEK